MALDQYIIEHPDYLLGQSPEEARIHPDNMFILMDHLKCASFELPFSSTETYGEFEVQELLAFLESEGVLIKTTDKWHWMTDSFPASEVSLRSASQENVIIIDKTYPKETKVIGEMDRFSAMTLPPRRSNLYSSRHAISSRGYSIGMKRKPMSQKSMSIISQMPILQWN